MRSMMGVVGSSVAGLLLCWGGLPGPAQGQAGAGVARSGMEQGEASVSTRSDVRMGIESGPGTSGRRLQAMAAAVSSSMGRVRECYAQLAAERPDITGAMQLRVTLPAGRARVALEIAQDSTNQAVLTRCVRRAIEAASYREVERPAIVTVRLDFDNSAAAGSGEVARRRAIEDRVAVRRAEGGALEATGGNASGEVRFTVRGQAGSREETVAAVQRGVRAAIPGLLDCRRRAGRREMDPEGRIVADLRIPRRGRVVGRVVSGEIQDTRAPTCALRVLSRARFEEAAAGHVHVELRFAPRGELGVPARD